MTGELHGTARRYAEAARDEGLEWVGRDHKRECERWADKLIARMGDQVVVRKVRTLGAGETRRTEYELDVPPWLRLTEREATTLAAGEWPRHGAVGEQVGPGQWRVRVWEC